MKHMLLSFKDWLFPPEGPVCKCDSIPCIVVVDKNSYKKWCGECGGRLWGRE